jgi:hypothetical protein
MSNSMSLFLQISTSISGGLYMTSYINLTISSRLHTTVENFCTLFHLWTILRRHGQRENYPRLKNITFSRGPKFGFCVGSLMVLRRVFFHVVWTNIYIKIRKLKWNSRLLLNNIWKLCQESFSFLLRERRGLVQAVRHHRINHVRRNVNGAAKKILIIQIFTISKIQRN